MLQSEGGSRDVTKSSFKTVPDPTEGETTADKIDWSGASPSLPGVYTSATSGDWFKEAKVVILYHITSL